MRGARLVWSGPVAFRRAPALLLPAAALVAVLAFLVSTGSADARPARLAVRPARTAYALGSRAAQGPLPFPGAAPLQFDGRQVPGGPYFPHLLMVPQGFAGAPHAQGRALGGNAHLEPGSAFPPSVLSRERRRRAATIAGTRDARAIRSLIADARANPGEPDTLRVLVLRVDFNQDTAGSKTTGDGHFDLDSSDVARARPIDPPPHNQEYFDAQMQALARYYRVMSGGSLVLQWDVWPAGRDSAYHLPDTRTYGPWIWSNSNPDVFQHAIDFVGDALKAADRDPDLQFSRYRHIRTADGVSDTTMSVMIFHAGGDLQGDINRDSPWDIPSFNLGVYDPFVVRDSLPSGPDSIGINLVMVVPETVNQDGFYGAMNGVLAHEFGHQLGFFDLYDVRTGASVVGAFSLMDSGENQYGYVQDPADTTQVLGVRGMLPASLDPWHKVLYFPEGVDMPSGSDVLHGDSTDFEVHLPAVEVSNRILYQPLNLSEYLLAENRVFDLNRDGQIILKADKKTGVILGPEPDSSAVGDTLASREYDYLLPGEGVVVWHIDQAALLTGLYTDFGGVNVLPGRPGVGVVEGDGIQDIGMASSEYYGGPYDPYFVGGYTCLGPDTHPSSATNDGTPTGLTLCVLDSLGLDMRVRLSDRQNPVGWPLGFPGIPGEEQLVALPLEANAPPAVLTVSGERIVGWTAEAVPIKEDAGQGEVFVQLPDQIEGGLAARPDFHRPGHAAPEPLVAALSSGRLWMMDRQGSAEVWPAADTTGLSHELPSSSPVILDSLVLVGCRDGVIRGVVPGAGEARVQYAAAEQPIRLIGAGEHDGRRVVFWAAEGGQVGALSETGAAAGTTLFRTMHQGASLIPVAMLAAPAGPAGALRFLYAWSDGTLEWRDADGALLPGWPVSMGADPAGEPIVCDADQDGALETVAVDRAGRMHMFTWEGTEDFHWPRTLWSEDDRNPPPQRTGPRAIDVNGDGVPEIVIQRADGMLRAVNGEGKEVAGWPKSIGGYGVSGPYWIAASGSYAARMMTGAELALDGNRTGTALGAIRVQGAGGEGTGFFPVPGMDQARSRFYPLAWVPGPKPAEGDLGRETLRIYPNPLRGDRVTVRFVLGRPAQITLEAFDLSGRKVASMETNGAEGAPGNEIPWDLSRLSPGLYHIRFRARGEGFDRQLFSKLAVVR